MEILYTLERLTHYKTKQLKTHLNTEQTHSGLFLGI